MSKQWSKQNKSNIAYLEHFIRSKCAVDLLINRIFPDCKEITEAWGAFEATARLPDGYEWNNPNVLAVVVGDGATPRVGATVAMRTAWEVISIDPNLAPKLYDIKRLSLRRCRIEETLVETTKNVVLFAIHSHACLKASVKSIKTPKMAVIAMPCCVKLILDQEPDVCFTDVKVLCPGNEIKIWKCLRQVQEV